MADQINLVDIATWLTGIFTLGLFLIGYFQIRNERIARKKSEKELELRTIRHQAELISSWIPNEEEPGWIAVSNQSQLPVYQVIVSVVVLCQGGEQIADVAAGQACISVAPPGLGYVVVGSDYEGMHRRPGIEIAFRDAAGRNWVRKADGKLIGIDKSPVEYYAIELPTEWKGLSGTMSDSLG